MLPFSFKSEDDFRTMRLMIEALTLKHFDHTILEITGKLLNGLPCEIEIFAELIETYKTDIQVSLNNANNANTPDSSST